DVGARAAVQDERERVVGAEDALAEVAGGRGLRDRPLEDLRLLLILAADVDEGAVRVRGVGGDDHPLDEHVRGLLHQLAVLEGARLGLVGVADEVLVDRPSRQERDLLAHRESCPAAAAQAGVEQVLQDLLARHSQRALERLVAAAALVHVDRREAGLVDVREQQQLAHAPWSSSGTSLSAAPEWSASGAFAAEALCSASAEAGGVCAGALVVALRAAP